MQITRKYSQLPCSSNKVGFCCQLYRGSQLAAVFTYLNSGYPCYQLNNFNLVQPEYEHEITLFRNRVHSWLAGSLRFGGDSLSEGSLLSESDL